MNATAKKKPTKTSRQRRAASVVVKALRVEPKLWEHAESRVKSLDLDFSKYVRHLIRADLKSAELAAA